MKLVKERTLSCCLVLFVNYTLLVFAREVRELSGTEDATLEHGHQKTRQPMTSERHSTLRLSPNHDHRHHQSTNPIQTDDQRLETIPRHKPIADALLQQEAAGIPITPQGEIQSVASRLPGDIKAVTSNALDRSKEFQESVDRAYAASPPQFQSFLNSILSWWSQSSSNSSSSSSLSSSGQPKVASHISEPSGSSVSEHHGKASTSIDVTSAHARRGDQDEVDLTPSNTKYATKRKFEFYRRLKRMTDHRSSSKSVRSAGAKKRRTYQKMLRDRPVSHGKKHRKARPKRRTRKRKKLGHKSRKKKRLKGRVSGSPRVEIGKSQIAVKSDSKTSKSPKESIDEELSHGIDTIIHPTTQNSIENVTQVDKLDTTTTMPPNDGNKNIDAQSIATLNDLNAETMQEKPQQQSAKIIDSRHTPISTASPKKPKFNLGIDLRVRTHQQNGAIRRGDIGLSEDEIAAYKKQLMERKSAEDREEKTGKALKENEVKIPKSTEGKAVQNVMTNNKNRVLELDADRDSATKVTRNNIQTDRGTPIEISQTGTGIFATVRELVMTVKDLYAHQESNRQTIKELSSRYRSHRTDLHLTEARVANLDQNYRSILSTLQNLDVTAGGIRKEMSNFRNRQHRSDRNQRRLRLEMERLLDKVNRLEEGYSHIKALHEQGSGHLHGSSEQSISDSKRRRVADRIERLERLDYKRSTRTNKLNKRVDTLEGVLDTMQANLKDVAAEAKTCSDQLGSLRLDLGDLNDKVEVSMNPEFLEVFRSLNENDRENGNTDSRVSENGEYLRPSGSDEKEENVGSKDVHTIIEGKLYTTESNLYAQDESGSGDGKPGTDLGDKTKNRKSRHLNPQFSRDKSTTTSSSNGRDVTQPPFMSMPITSTIYQDSTQPDMTSSPDRQNGREEGATAGISSTTETQNELSSSQESTTSTEITDEHNKTRKDSHDKRIYVDSKDVHKNRLNASDIDSASNNSNDELVTSETVLLHNESFPLGGNHSNNNKSEGNSTFQSNLSAGASVKPTPTLSDVHSRDMTYHKAKTDTNNLISDTLSASFSSLIDLPPTNASKTTTATAGFSQTLSTVLSSGNEKTSRNIFSSVSLLSSTPTTTAQAEELPSTTPSVVHHTEQRQFSWTNTILQQHINYLEQRIRTLESSMMKLTSSTVPGLRQEVSKVLANHTTGIKAKFLHQQAVSKNQTSLLKEKIAENYNKSSLLEEEFRTREIDMRRLKTITGQTSMMLSDLANQVSAINMTEFISRLQQSLANFSQSVLTIDQWKVSSGYIINTTIDHEAKIAQLMESIKTNSQKTTKLMERVVSVQASSRRWYRNLQGHVIRLNNTVQDFKERTEHRMQQTKHTQSAQPSLELQSKMDNLHIQLLYNSNRLSSIETNMLNRSLEQCRRTATELEQQSAILRYGQEQRILRNDISLIQEKVQRIDLSVYRIHSNSKTSDAIMAKLSSDVQHLKPMTSQVVRLEKEVDNLLHQLPRDCQAYYSRGYRESGVYIIHPKLVDRSIRVYCVMEDYLAGLNVALTHGTDKIITNIDHEENAPRSRESIINDGNIVKDHKSTSENGGDKTNTSSVNDNVKKRHGKKKEVDGSSANKRDKALTPKVTGKSKRSLPEDQESLVNSMESDANKAKIYNGGWTVIQRRFKGDVNFTRPWVEYAMGFGRAADEYWLGNDIIHLLTNQDSYECRILMTDVFDGIWEARYDHFRMGSQAENYRLQVSGYHGNASDGLSSSNHMSFSTLDRDNDASSSHCALYGRGGWWYRHCHISNLNGPFDVGLVWFNRAWKDWVQMKASFIMVKPRGAKTRS